MSRTAPSDPRPPPPAARATIRTVAADAGVSVAAVSKVLRNAYGVSDALRARVAASIEKLGYRPSKAAQGMRGRSTSVGVLLVELGNPFLPGVVDGIQDALGPAGLQALIGVGREQSQLETALIESMIDQGTAGLILVAPMLPSAVIARYAREVPIVLVAHHEDEAQGFDTVNGDDRLGARLATEALLARGHRDVGFLTSHRVAAVRRGTVILQREEGYRAAMAAAGLAPRLLELVGPLEAREAEIAALLARGDRPRALVCWSDLDAVPLLGAAAAAGLRVPGDLAVVGYDDSPLAASPLLGLSSVNQDGPALGRRAARALLERIEGRAVAEHAMLVPRLVLRSSV